MNNGARLKGVTIDVSSRLQPSVVEVILVDERIMRLRLKHTLGFMSLVAVYAPTEVCGADEKEMFYAKLDCSGSVPPPGYTQSWVTSMLPLKLRAGYELCVGPHGSGTRNTNSSLLLNFPNPEG